MGHMGVKITAIDASLPVLLICVGSAYSIHVLNQYYEDLVLIRDEISPTASWNQWPTSM